jgi:hypothetical protein
VPDPERLVVDLEGIALDGALRELVAKVQPNDPYIRQVRVGQFRPGVTRLVFDLKSRPSPRCSASSRWPATAIGWCSTCGRPFRSTRWPS